MEKPTKFSFSSSIESFAPPPLRAPPRRPRRAALAAWAGRVAKNGRFSTSLKSFTTKLHDLYDVLMIIY